MTDKARNSNIEIRNIFDGSNVWRRGYLFLEWIAKYAEPSAAKGNRVERSSSESQARAPERNCVRFDLHHLNFGFVSDFGFRISELGLSRSHSSRIDGARRLS
jgi:hypothetical protein